MPEVYQLRQRPLLGRTRKFPPWLQSGHRRDAATE